MPLDDPIHWLDVDEIGERLAAAHPSIDPIAVRFTDLKRLVQALPGFAERPGHPVNERILEEIQAAWIEWRAGGTMEEEE